MAVLTVIDLARSHVARACADAEFDVEVRPGRVLRVYPNVMTQLGRTFGGALHTHTGTSFLSAYLRV
jgi:hypothetical protein